MKLPPFPGELVRYLVERPFIAHVLGIYRLPQGKKDELEKEMKEWMKQQDETRFLQSPREQSIRKCTKEHKKV